MTSSKRQTEIWEVPSSFCSFIQWEGLVTKRPRQLRWALKTKRRWRSTRVRLTSVRRPTTGKNWVLTNNRKRSTTQETTASVFSMSWASFFTTRGGTTRQKRLARWLLKSLPILVWRQNLGSMRITASCCSRACWSLRPYRSICMKTCCSISMTLTTLQTVLKFTQSWMELSQI